MDANKRSIGSPKSIADVLVEELEGEVGDACTQESSVEGRQKRLREVCERIHEEAPERSALCLSGGGIRSASFGLGILQGLARKGLLGKFDYLSTVSGGGYVGGWLSAWMYHETEGARGEAEPEAGSEAEEGKEAGERGRQRVLEQLSTPPDRNLNPEPQPVRHLRAYSNYLTPRLGFFSADAWTLIATFLRNMLLNWLVLISWCAAVLMLPRLFVMAVFIRPTDLGLNLLLGGAIVMIGWAMAYTLVDTPCTGNARWPQRNFILFRQVPLFLAALLLVTWWAGYSNTHAEAAYLREPEAMWLFASFLVIVYLVGGVIGESMIASRQRAKMRRGRGGEEGSGEKSELTAEDGSPGWQVFAAVGRLFSIVVVTSVGGYFLWLFAVRVFPMPAQNAFSYVCYAPPFVLGVFLLVNFLFAGMASWVSEDEDREWWGRSAAWLCINIVGWLVLAMIALRGPLALEKLFAAEWRDAWLRPLVALCGGTAGLVGALLGFSSGTPAGTPKDGSGKGRQLLLGACALVFVLFLSLVVSEMFVWRIRDRLAEDGADRRKGLEELVGYLYRKEGEVSPYDYPNPGDPKWEAWRKDWDSSLLIVQAFADATFTFTGLVLFGIAAGFFINVNEFSLHCVYRNRLIRAFLGASRPKEKRSPHRFTGFDPEDNVAMSDLPKGRPLHVINIALNIVKGGQLAWQERKAESFTVSRLHCGGWSSGYRPAEKYAGGMTLGTAMTISGAAASPNMGYHSSPLVSFLMTLFNVRLGWWLGNPGEAGAHTWTKPGPTYALGPLFAEAFGMTRRGYKYVSLSDGGHFDNLGLYEMVLRRCRYIVVVDAGWDLDYNFEDLGNALRKIRIDFGIPIDIEVASPLKAEEKDRVWHCAVGKIRYSRIDRLEDGSVDPKRDGHLIYIKPLLKGRIPADVRSYREAHPEFPHESTSDQWFNESQLESYRSLGVHMAESICGEKSGCETLPKFFEEAGRRAKREEA